MQKEHWNTHPICKFRFDCISGRLDSKFHIPERYSGGDMKIEVSDNKYQTQLKKQIIPRMKTNIQGILFM